MRFIYWHTRNLQTPERITDEKAANSASLSSIEVNKLQALNETTMYLTLPFWFQPLDD